MGLQRGGLLDLHRTVDGNENLATLDPVACVDKNARYLTTFADNANGNFAASGQCAGGVDRADNGVASGGHHSHCLRLRVLFVTGRGCSAASAHEIIGCTDGNQYGHDDQGDDDPTTARVFALREHSAVQRSGHCSFVIHIGFPNLIAGQ